MNDGALDTLGSGKTEYRCQVKFTLGILAFDPRLAENKADIFREACCNFTVPDTTVWESSVSSVVPECEEKCENTPLTHYQCHVVFTLKIKAITKDEAIGLGNRFKDLGNVMILNTNNIGYFNSFLVGIEEQTEVLEKKHPEMRIDLLNQQVERLLNLGKREKPEKKSEGQQDDVLTDPPDEDARVKGLQVLAQLPERIIALEERLEILEQRINELSNKIPTAPLTDDPTNYIDEAEPDSQSRQQDDRFEEFLFLQSVGHDFTEVDSILWRLFHLDGLSDEQRRGLEKLYDDFSLIARPIWMRGDKLEREISEIVRNAGKGGDA